MAFANAHNIEDNGWTVTLGYFGFSVQGYRLPPPPEGFAVHLLPALRLKVAWYKSFRWLYSVDFELTFIRWKALFSIFKQ